MDRRLTRRARQHAVLAAIARREWLLQMLALTAASCGLNGDRAYARAKTLIVAVDDNRPLRPDWPGEFLVFLPLVREDWLTGDRRGCLASHWEHSSDYRDWTYGLRPDVQWHDGRPVTVDDVKFTLELHSQPNSPYMSGLLPLTESVTVHDKSTFTVRGGQWSQGGGGQDWVVSILPKHLLQDLDYQKFYDWDFWLRPIGCGPYRYLRHDPQTMVELEANPDYYKGKPRIERVGLKFSAQAGLTELLSGNVDAVELNAGQLPAVTNDLRFQVHVSPHPQRPWSLVWQNANPLFQDREVRRGLSLAINRRELLQVLSLPSQFALVDGVNTQRQFRRGELLEPRYDPSEAKRLLDEAGWLQRSPDGTRERNGHFFRFTALTLSEAPANETAVFVQNQLRGVGVQMDLLPLERSALRDRLTTGKFEAIVSSVFAPYFEPSWDGVGYRRLSKLFEVTKTTSDPEVVDQAYREMSDLVRDDQPVAFLFRSFFLHVVHRRVKGLSAPLRGNPILFAEDLWLENEH